MCILYTRASKKPNIDGQTNGGAGKWYLCMYVESLDESLFLGVIFTLYWQSAHKPNRGKCIIIGTPLPLARKSSEL